MFLTELGVKWTETSADVRAQCWNKTSLCALYSFWSVVSFPPISCPRISKVSTLGYVIYGLIFCSPSFTISKKLYTWVIKSICKVNHPPSTCCLSVSLAICFLFPPPRALSFFYWLSRVSFSSALYHLSFSRLILSCCLPLQLSGEPGRLFQCMREQIITLQSLCQLFSPHCLLELYWCGERLSLCSGTLFTKASDSWI